MQWPCLLNSFWMHLIVWNRTSFIIITHLVLTVFVNIVVTYLRIKRLSFHQLTLALLMGSTSLDQLAYNFLLRVCSNQAGFIVLAASIVTYMTLIRCHKAKLTVLILHVIPMRKLKYPQPCIFKAVKAICWPVRMILARLEQRLCKRTVITHSRSAIWRHNA